MGIKRVLTYIVLAFLLGGALSSQIGASPSEVLREDNQVLALEVAANQVTVDRLQRAIEHMTGDDIDPDLLQPGIVCDSGVLYLDNILGPGTSGPFAATICQRGKGLRISNPDDIVQAIRFIAGIEAPKASPIH